MDYETKQQLSGQASRGLRDIAPTPKEPGPLDKARETLGYLREIEDLHVTLREKLYGPVPCQEPNDAKVPHEPCLEEMLHDISQRSAMAVGELKSILNRL